MQLSRATTPAFLALGLLATTFLAACGDDEEAGVDVDGRQFVATEIEGHTIVEGSEVVLSFADGTLLVEAGCNSQRGGYEVTDGVLQVEPMASTMMACDEALMAQDQLVATILSSGPTVEQDGTELVITSADTAMTLTERE